MKKSDLRILLLEDDPLDAELNIEQLSLLEEFNCIVTIASDKKSYLNALEKEIPDIVLSDYNLPQYNGSEALIDVRSKDALVPFIFVTGAMQEELAAEAIKNGAWDYVVKDRLFRLPLAIRSVLKVRDERASAFEAEKKANMLLMAIEQTSSQIIVSDKEYNIEYVNRKFTEITGNELKGILGKQDSIVLNEKFSEINDILIQGEVYKGESSYVDKNGSEYWELLSITPIKNSKNVITNFVTVKEDITQLKMIEEALIQARDKAEQSDKLKSAFLQNLSHEIRTPLNAICGFSNLIKDYLEVDTPEILNFASIIEKNSEQLLAIVSDVLTMSSIETGLEVIIEKSINIDSVMTEVYDVFSRRMADKEIEFTVQAADNEALYIISDRAKLIQILSNLLDNAIKFTSEGSIKLEYIVYNSHIDFNVTDTGIGLTNEASSLIFERFRQADPSISIDFGGTGLGLAISSSYAEMLGGKLTVESELNVGSTFTLTLPLVDGISIVPQITRSNTLIKQDPITILVAEDEIYNYVLLESFLKSENIKMFHGENGQIALEKFKENAHIDLVIMDIKMPIMNGIECLQEIRKINQSVPVIALTAYAFEHEKQQLLSQGFTDYLAKPVQKSNLIMKLNKVLYGCVE